MMELAMAQPGLFDLDERYRRLSETGDPLVKLAALIDFEVFRPRLAGARSRRIARIPDAVTNGCKGGLNSRRWSSRLILRPPW
jgi:hypothetical protein